MNYMTQFESNLLHTNSYLATFIYYQVANALTRGKWEAHIDEYALPKFTQHYWYKNHFLLCTCHQLAAGASHTVSLKML